MDHIVTEAMAKWPHVPHCYGWLALDARGNWRMRDEQAQAGGLAGDKIQNAALLAFINRNYTSDERGCWYFQNGPQRVYVDLEATPYIARTDPQHGFLLQTGAALLDGTQQPSVWLTEYGRLLLHGAGKIALLDDRDAGECLAALEMNGAPLDEDTLEAWLAGGPGQLSLRYRNWQLPVAHLHDADIAARFAFVALPRA